MTAKQFRHLRINHNKLVKDYFKIPFIKQPEFNEWFENNCEHGEDGYIHYEGQPCFTFVELPSYQTKSGHAEILEC
jgi:hypothetical protein